MTKAPLQHILYIDDEEDIRTVAQMALEMVGGMNVAVCCCGRDGLDAARANPPQMILLDVMMPDMDGPETFAALRADPELADIPVAFMTAKIRPEEISDLMRLGVAGVIAKPFDPMTLADQVRNVWNTFQDK
ncbi:response regulator [Micavibrio aeruginosavorus]|uniref:Response regulator n=1 Tax=Micavibrio aeruginosavorus (strain ARL-13) TaxID=856793 RepID=G2KRY4_MICAA|nr:response regulator [Micavibrio aeruginosavorus]AEP10492.1 response regulator [Micavibrio aeruginosavorus ARL-13]